MRGGEKVVESLCRLLPEADLFTLFYEPERVSEVIRSRRVTASFLNPLRRWHRWTLPLMPVALEQFDLRGYDLVISSESGPAKGVLTSSRTRHVCYCHTPMRYLWELNQDYLHDWTRSRLRRAVMAPVATWLRQWDYATAARVDTFVANSENVKRRIWKTYRREAEVVYPPVAVESFYGKPAEDYYLAVSELVPYKRMDEAVASFRRSGRRLKVVGEGSEYRRLRGLAGGSVEFLGRVTEEELRDLYARCRALVMPGEEDFGMTAVEALASGKPVVALGRGGALETVASGGVLYDAPGEANLTAAMARFEAVEARFEPEELRRLAAPFSAEEFEGKMREMLLPSGCSA